MLQAVLLVISGRRNQRRASLYSEHIVRNVTIGDQPIGGAS
jgi:hypothetical protein